MASRLKSDFRTAGDATRFGGQPPSFYLDASNFTGTNGLTINAGGTGASTASAARTNLSLYSKSEIDTKVSTATLGNANVIVNGNNNITVDSSSIKMTLNGTAHFSWDASTAYLNINANIVLTGTIDGISNVAGKAHAANSWGDHRNVGYLTAVPLFATSTLTDVGDTSPTTGQYLAWSGTEYSPVSLSISSFGINDLNDIDTENYSVGIGNVLKWNGAKWIPDTDKSNAVQTINDLNDVDTQSIAPSLNRVLTWTGAEWSPRKLDDIISSLNLTTATLNDLNVDFGIIPD